MKLDGQDCKDDIDSSKVLVLNVVNEYSSLPCVMASKNRCVSYPTLQFAQKPQHPHGSCSTSTSTSSSSTVNQTISDHGDFAVEHIHIGDAPSVDMLSTSAVLHYCKRIILVPYVRLLTMLGWRPVLAEDGSCCLKMISWVYAVVVILFTLLGYVLQGASCFRRDRASSYKFLTASSGGVTVLHWDRRHCDGSIMGLYLLPSALHLVAYGYTFYLLRIAEYEQIQILMEKAFLQTYHSPMPYITQPKLVKTLRSFLIACVVWLLLSIVAQILHVTSDMPTFTWMDDKMDAVRIGLVCLMLMTLLWHDLIHVTILWSYGIQCQLLLTFLNTLFERLMGKMDLQGAIKEIDESYKLLKHLNDDMAIAVAILLLYSGSMLASGVIWLLTPDCPCTGTTMNLTATLLSVLTWGVAFSFPIVQAARLTAACRGLRRIGHHIRARPFGYQDTLQQDLDSFVLYTSTLNMQSTLFRVPVRAGFVFSILAVSVFLLLLLGQLNLINLGI